MSRIAIASILFVQTPEITPVATCYCGSLSSPMGGGQACVSLRYLLPCPAGPPGSSGRELPLLAADLDGFTGVGRGPSGLCHVRGGEDLLAVVGRPLMGWSWTDLQSVVRVENLRVAGLDVIGLYLWLDGSRSHGFQSRDGLIAISCDDVGMTALSMVTESYKDCRHHLVQASDWLHDLGQGGRQELEDYYLLCASGRMPVGVLLDWLAVRGVSRPAEWLCALAWQPHPSAVRWALDFTCIEKGE